MVAAGGSGESGLGDAWTVNTANPLPTPTDNNPSASQGDLASSNLYLNSGGCYGSVNISSGYSYSNFGSGTSLTTPTPWVNGGDCAYGSLGSNSAGGNTDSFATCPPTQADVNDGLVSCSIIASSGNDNNGSINYTTDDLFFNGQPVPQQSTATLSAAATCPVATVTVTGGTNWWGSADGAPNTGPYGDDQNGAGTLYQVERAERLHRHLPGDRGARRQLDGDHPRQHLRLHRCREHHRRPQSVHDDPGAADWHLPGAGRIGPGYLQRLHRRDQHHPAARQRTERRLSDGAGDQSGHGRVGDPLVVGRRLRSPRPTAPPSPRRRRDLRGHRDAALRTPPSRRPARCPRRDLRRQRQRTATLSGTPAAGTGGSYPITITATDGSTRTPPSPSPSRSTQAPAITSASHATFAEETAGTFTVTASGNPTSSLGETGTLPSGVTFVDNGNGTATLAGTPAAGTAGSYPITITASNGVNPDATQSFTLTVDAAPAITSAPTPPSRKARPGPSR